MKNDKYLFVFQKHHLLMKEWRRGEEASRREASYHRDSRQTLYSSGHCDALRSTELLTGKSLHTTAPEVASQFTASHLHKAQCNCRNATLNINCDNVFLKVNRKKNEMVLSLYLSWFFFCLSTITRKFRCKLSMLTSTLTPCTNTENWTMKNG